MGLFDRMKVAVNESPAAAAPAMTESRSGSPENPSTSLANPASWLVDWATGGASPAGVVVNEQKAMHHSIVASCVKILAETLAMLPLPVYRRLPRGRETAREHPLYRLLHDRPNPELTSFAYRELVQTHLGFRGNAYAEIEYAKSGKILALWPLTPSRVTPFRRDGEKRFSIELPNGGKTVLGSDRVMHVMGFGYDGLQGLSPVGLARNAIGLSLAAEEFGSRFFGNGARPGGIITRPPGQAKLSEPAKENLRSSFERKHEGLSNAHRVAILEEGTTFAPLGVNPDDAQFLETRKFQKEEICGWYRIPPHLVANLDRSTNNNIEQQSLEFIIYTMQPWLTRHEQVMNWDLVSEDERGEIYAEFNVDGLLRGDVTARGEYYTKLFNIGVLSRNDIRERDNMNPVEGGDRYFVQGALVPVDMIDAGLAASALLKMKQGAGSGASTDPAADPAVPTKTSP